MTDRELLELAAKSAGIGLIAWTKFFDEWKFACNPCGEPWNPLIDDGDALRLAVKLGMTVCNEHESAGSVCCTRGDEVFPAVNSGEVGDPPGITENDYAATRRAIVRAAAELAKQEKV